MRLLEVVAAEARSDVIDAASKATLHHPVRKKGPGEAVCASLSPQLRVGAALPVAEILVDGTMHIALIDSDCSQCIVYEPCCVSWNRQSVTVVTVN